MNEDFCKVQGHATAKSEKCFFLKLICFLGNLAEAREKKKSGILVIEIWKAGKGLVFMIF